MHLDKLLSWDDMRDTAIKPKKKRLASRLPESEFFTEEVHDIFSRIQFQEISEDGTYQPVEVIQSSVSDGGVYQLHQGLQRRIVVNLTHTSGETLQWHDIAGLRVGRVRLVDSTGTAPGLDSPVHEIPVQLVHAPTVKANADGTTNVTFIGQWDSSAHGSLLLDRATPDKYRVQVSLLWNVSSIRLATPMIFSLDLDVQIRSRNFMRQTSLFGFANLWNTTRVIHSTTGIFSVAIRPTSVKRATDLWRMNTRDDFVKGEEMLVGWTPRGVSLIKDFLATQKRRRRVAEIETARSLLSSRALTLLTTNGTTNGISTASDNLDDRQKALLTRVLGLWQTKKEPAEIILQTTNIEPPISGAAFAARPLLLSNPNSSQSTPTLASASVDPTADLPSPNPTLVATVRHIPKNPTLMKGGYLLMPDPSSSRWVRRYVELRKPYLHIYSVPEGDEINAINMRNSRVDHSPQIARLLGGGSGNAVERGKESVWAVFARGNSYLFRARGEREKIEWILRIDESYFSSGSESPEE